MKKNSYNAFFNKALISYGASVLALCLISLCLGDAAKDISPMFEFDSRAVPIPILLELAGLAILFSFERFLFFTDRIIKKMGLVMRTAFLAVSSILTGVIFVLVFKWFPSDNFLAWLSFVISFFVCFIISLMVTAHKEKSENKKMGEALKRIQNDSYSQTR